MQGKNEREKEREREREREEGGIDSLILTVCQRIKDYLVSIG